MNRQELLAAASERYAKLGRRGLRRRSPVPRRPEQQVRSYQAALRKITRAIEQEVRERVFTELDAIISEADLHEDMRLDNWGQRLMDLFRATRTAIEPVIGRTREIMLSLGDDTAERATSEQIKAVRSVLGVSPSFYDDRKMRGLLNDWKTTNGAFITRMADDAVQKMQDAASRAVRQGKGTGDVRKALRKEFGISDRRARVIARTEISQLSAQVTRVRQTELGIDGYYWETAHDDRVRDSHEELDGEFFTWDNPPSATDGQHPGEPINCRCVARPALDRLLDQLESE